MTAQEIKVWIIPVGQQSVTIDDLVNRLAAAQWPPVAGTEKEDFDQSFDEFSAHRGIKGELLEAAKKGLLTVFDSRTGGPLTLSKNEEFPPGALVKVADLPAYLATRLNGLRVALATAGVETPDSAQSVQPATQAAPKEQQAPPPPIEAVPRFAAQERAVLEYLTGCEVNARALPPRAAGKPGIKAEARKALQGKPLFVGDKIFDKAWERLRAAREIQGGN